jgi:hypothetical protein
MKRNFLFCLIVIIALAAAATAQTSGEKEAITRTALNYAEGWYEGNSEKMESALHPELAKRMVESNQQGRSRLDQMSALTLVHATRGRFGKQTPKDQQLKDVTILDVFNSAASVRLEMQGWIDYLHIAKFNGKWVIVNVLWELKPRKEAAKN